MKNRTAMGIYPVSFTYLCKGRFFITSQQRSEIENGASSKKRHLIYRWLYHDGDPFELKPFK